VFDASRTKSQILLAKDVVLASPPHALYRRENGAKLIGCGLRLGSPHAMNAILKRAFGYDVLHGKNLSNTSYLHGPERLPCIQDKCLFLFS
jgi:hypothetical protein